MDKPLTTPRFRLTLPELELSEGFGINYVSSKDSHCDTCRIFPGNDILEEIRDADVSDCLVEMGCEEDYDDLIEGVGTWQKSGTDILIRDGMTKLLATIVTETFLECHPQEVIRYILTLCGVEKYVLSERQYAAKTTFTVDSQDACEAIKQMNSTWGINEAFFFWGDTFYWGAAPEQEDVYELNNQNILNLDKEGDKWTADIIGVPWLHHSQVVIIDHDKLIGVGEIEKVVIQSSGSGFCDMYVEFREVQDSG